MAIWVKDPADIAWFQFQWGNLLGTGETITTYTIACDANLTQVAQAVTGSDTSIQVSGGVSGGQSLVTGSILTSDGNTYHAEKTIYIATRIVE